MAKKKIKLSDLDLSKKVTDKQYEIKCEKIQLPLLQASIKVRDEEIPAILLFEGRDGAGKSEAIKEFTYPMEQKVFYIENMDKPDPIENQYHYLRRYWLRLPAKGELAIMDRTWHSRVLVDRVEKRISGKDLERGYKEINDFEKTLTDEGYVLIKFLMNVSKEKELERFKEREEDPHQQHKLTDDDWRNRSKWDQYTKAYEDMLQRNSPSYAPWHIIEAEDYNYSRLKIMKIIVQTLGIKCPFELE